VGEVPVGWGVLGRPVLELVPELPAPVESLEGGPELPELPLPVYDEVYVAVFRVMEPMGEGAEDAEVPKLQGRAVGYEVQNLLAGLDQGITLSLQQFL
jgi:hypothetical protein